MTWRGDEELIDRVRQAATRAGWSVNEWVTRVLDAATDPDLAGTEPERVRERLSRAGLLEETTAPSTRPDPVRVVQARRAASKGTPLSDLVSDARR